MCADLNTTQCKNKNKQNDLYLLLKKFKLPITNANICFPSEYIQ